MPRVTNLQVERRQGLRHSIVISRFTYGFDHKIEYERRDAVTRLLINIRLDDGEIYRKDAGLFDTIGLETVPFTIEGVSLGRIQLRMLAVVLFLKVSVDGTDVMRV
jgi:hypothetical protein